MTTPIAYPIGEAARIAGVSTDTLRMAIRATEAPYLKAKKVGGRYLVTAQALADWLESLPDA